MPCNAQFLKLKNFSEIVRINENTVGDKQTQYFQQTQDGKQILREVMNRIIPRKLPMLKSKVSLDLTQVGLRVIVSNSLNDRFLIKMPEFIH